MTDRVKMIDHVHATMRDEVTRFGPETWRLLGDWSGEFSATTAGASPSSAPTMALDADGNPVVHLTKLESAALNGDAARRRRRRFARLLVELVVACEDIWCAVGEPPDPDRASRLRADTGLSFVAGCVWRLRVDRRALDRPSVEDLRSLKHRVDRLGSICVANNRPPFPARVCCLAHAEIGSEVDVAPRYSRLRLCRWCGEFKAMYGQVPPREIIRQHDKGVRITRDVLRRAGIVRANA